MGDSNVLAPLSPMRGSRRAGRPAPARPDPLTEKFGRHPADIVADGFERDRVMALRARRLPWAHVAQQLGLSEIYLRRAYAGLDWPARPAEAVDVKVEVKAAAAPAPPAFGASSYNEGLQPRLLRMLGAYSRCTVRQMIELSGNSTATVTGTIAKLLIAGLIVNRTPGTFKAHYDLTAAGVARLAEIKAKAARK